MNVGQREGGREKERERERERKRKRKRKRKRERERERENGQVYSNKVPSPSHGNNE